MTSFSRRLSCSSAVSLRPSPLGESQRWPLRPTTGGAPLSRCAAKNAPNVARTSARKTTRASRLTASARRARRSLRGLVLAEDHDDVRVLAQVARVRVEPADVGDVQLLRDRARLARAPERLP